MVINDPWIHNLCVQGSVQPLEWNLSGFVRDWHIPVSWENLMGKQGCAAVWQLKNWWKKEEKGKEKEKKGKGERSNNGIVNF